MSTNERIKGYKKTKLGWIPEEWGVSYLNKHSDFITKGSTPTTYGYNWVDHGVLFLRSQCVSKNGLDLKEAMRISNEANESLSRSKVESGDILMTITGNVGRVIKLKESFEGGNINQHIARIRINDKAISCDFIFQYFQQERIRNQYLKITTGQAYPQISLKQVRNSNFPVPSLLEQQKIAEILSTWDTAIQKLDALIKAKEKQKKALIEQLVSGKKRIPGYKAKWNKVKLGEVTTKFSRRNKKLINARVYSVTNDRGFVLQTDQFEREVAGNNLKDHKIIKRSEFAYNPARINVGSIAHFEDEIGIISSLYVCFSTKEELDDQFLKYILSLERTKFDINRYGEGGVRVYLWYDLFSSIKINLPNIEEQHAIVEILKKADQEIKLLSDRVVTLKDQKKGLMQQILTGQPGVTHLLSDQPKKAAS